MLLHVNPGSLNPTSILCAFFCLLNFVSSLEGQTIEPMVVQVPESPNDLDSVDHHLYVGSLAEPLADVYAIEMVYNYTGYQIYDNTSCVLQYGDSSWFNDDGMGEGSITFDTTNRKITVYLTRPVSDPRSGYGFVVMVPDIVVVIEEIGKRYVSSLQLEKVNYKFSLLVRTISVKQGIGLDWEFPITMGEVLMLNGKSLMTVKNASFSTLGIEGLPTGYYILRWRSHDAWGIIKLRVY